ncbi:hypothetical protein OAH18_02775 [bacterium]|nr:hypothetical protein [bacterium]
MTDNPYATPQAPVATRKRKKPLFVMLTELMTAFSVVIYAAGVLFGIVIAGFNASWHYWISDIGLQSVIALKTLGSLVVVAGLGVIGWISISRRHLQRTVAMTMSWIAIVPVLIMLVAMTVSVVRDSSLAQRFIDWRDARQSTPVVEMDSRTPISINELNARP